MRSFPPRKCLSRALLSGTVTTTTTITVVTEGSPSMNEQTTTSPAVGKEGWRPTKVHPLAALFPPLSEDELNALARDIKENGQRYPIIVDEKTSELIDGRMRLAACELAGVEPQFDFLNGNDPIAFIWSANGKRRHMTKGQMAMIAASNLWSDTDQRDDIETDIATAARQAGVSTTRFKEAGTVVRHAPHLVEPVIHGTVALDAAYEQARDNKREKEQRDEDMRLLREHDKDLAQKVGDGEMDLEEARDVLDARRKERNQRRNSLLHTLASVLDDAAGLERSTVLLELPAQLVTEEGHEGFRRYFPGGVKELGDKLAAARKGFAAVERMLSQMKQK
jgi:hypothetical protein